MKDVRQADERDLRRQKRVSQHVRMPELEVMVACGKHMLLFITAAVICMIVKK